MPCISRKTRNLALIFAVALLSGCGVRFKMRVDSIASPLAHQSRTYILMPGQQDVSSDDLHFKEFASIVDTALALRGFSKASSENVADMAVLLSYGVSEPETVSSTYSRPIYGRIGGGTSHYSGSISGSGGTSHYSGTVYESSSFGVVGSSTHTRHVTIYHRFLELEALVLNESREAQEATPIWKTTVVSSGSSGDMRLVFPYLVAGSLEYLAKDTRKAVTLWIGEKDERVKLLIGQTSQ